VPEQLLQLNRLVRQLGRHRDIVRIGAQRVIKVADDLLNPATRAATARALGAGSGDVVIEGFEAARQISWIARVNGRVRLRFYDMVLNVGGKRLFCEVKRWTAFPPNPRALESAFDQMRRDLVLGAVGTAQTGVTVPRLADLRWILPGNLSNSKRAIVDRFKAAVVGPEVDKALEAGYRAQGKGPVEINELIAKFNNDIEATLNAIFVFLP
jgi:hypothetical protein